MLDAMFSFRGRINRLQYFLRNLALGAALGVAAVMLLGMIGLHGAPTSPGAAPMLIVGGLLVIIAMPVVLWISLSLQSRRFRDIGLNPLYVVPALFAIGVVDTLVARGAPALSMGPVHQQTVIGLVINLVAGGCLLFWPGQAASGSGPDVHADWSLPDEPEPAHTGSVQAAPAAMWRASPAPAAAPDGRPSFGRRGL